MEQQNPAQLVNRSSHDWADRLRNIATVMVIAIHVAAPIAHVPSDVDTSWWWIGNLWNAASRPGVPLFVMLSGFLLLGKDYPLPVFLKRRFTRVLVPALFWMIVYLVYGFIANGQPAGILEGLRSMVVGPVHYHLWFIYLIVGLYLVYPMLRPWVKTARDQDFMYFFIMCIIGTWCYKILALFFDLPLGIHFELFTNNAGHFVLGYYLGAKSAADVPTQEGPIVPWRFSSRQLFFFGLGLVILGTGCTSIASYLLNMDFQPGQQFDVFFYDYLTPNVGLSAVGWFLMVRFGLDKHALLEVEKEFAAASFGIYLAHVLVMDWWGKCGYWHSAQHPIKGIPVLISLVTLMTFLVIMMLRALPGGKKIT